MENGEKPKNSLMRAFGLYSAVGFQLAASITLGAFGGRWLDQKLATEPWMMMLGVTLGAAAGFYNLVRLLNRK